MSAPAAPPITRREVLRLYRNLLKNAHRFPLQSRREIVTGEIKAAYRKTQKEIVEPEDLRYRMTLGWERNAAIAKYAENMYWFHSRDVVTKEMMHFSEARDRERAAEMERCNQVGDAQVKTEDVTTFKSTMYHVHPDYYNKVDMNPLNHPRDVWRARGTHGSDVGGPRQKFFVKRYKAMFPQGW